MDILTRILLDEIKKKIEYENSDVVHTKLIEYISKEQETVKSHITSIKNRKKAINTDEEDTEDFSDLP